MRKCFTIVFVLCICDVATAQTILKPRGLQVTINKTTNIIFPAAISSIDRGSENILVQKSTPNILRVKADSVFSDTTNLSVITTDGKLYSFLVSFRSSPEILNLDLGAGEVVTKDTALTRLANAVIKMKGNLYGLKYSSGQVQLSITGIYSTSEKLICKLKIENSSSLTFEAGQFRFHITAKNAGKRKASQETEVFPLLVSSPDKSVREKQSVVLAIVLPKVAVDRQKVLQIDCQEKNGERHLSLKLPNKFILNATLIL